MATSVLQPRAPTYIADDILDHKSPTYSFSFGPFLLKTHQLGLDADRPVCDAYTHGNCPNGTRCKKRHVADHKVNGGPSSGMNSLVCKHWLRGLCKKGEQCEFLHEYNLRKMPECNFFVKNGYCMNGEECLYLHIDPHSRLPPCPHYDQGFCPLGPICSKKHVRKRICTLYLAGFCPAGLSCKEGAHPKWRTNLEDPTVKTDKTEEDEVAAKRDLESYEERDRNRDRDDGRGGYGRFGGRGGRWRGKSDRKFRGRGGH